MNKYYVMLIAASFLACSSQSKKSSVEKEGIFSGVFTQGNFTDNITITIKKDSANWNVSFTSLEQNAFEIPVRNVEVIGDSINFILQSDRYTYGFKNKWTANSNQLTGSLEVDSLITAYTLKKETSKEEHTIKSQEITFESNGIQIGGTIWNATQSNKKGIVFITSSGQADRSGSRAEAIYFANKGYTTFHYDKRGTGTSEGNWQSATIEELCSDDINAITYFSQQTDIPLSNLGIKGSSQGGAKIPYILNNLEQLNFGIVVSCPGSTLLESDLNYWKNRNADILGPDIEQAVDLQRKVFKHIAGTLSRAELEKAVGSKKSEPWFSNVWVPNLDEVQIDKKIRYSPVPHFEKTKQAVLLIQGTSDNIIPADSHKIISNALKVAQNSKAIVVLLEDASHSMHNVGVNDFPYWSKMHDDYLTTMEDWLDTIIDQTN